MAKRVAKKALAPCVPLKRPILRDKLFDIYGTSTLVLNRFSQKSKEMMMSAYSDAVLKKFPLKPDSAISKSLCKEKLQKEKDDRFEAGRHRFKDGGDGIPVMSFKNGMLSTYIFEIGRSSFCSTPSLAFKIGLFVVGDGMEVEEGYPLVRIISESGPRCLEMKIRSYSGETLVRYRPAWDKWGALLRVRFDTRLFSPKQVLETLAILGEKIGICEGRAHSHNNCGMGWGRFKVRMRFPE